MNCPLYNNTEKAFVKKLEEKDVVLLSLFGDFSDRYADITEETPLIEVANLYINYLKDEYGEVFVGEFKDVLDSIVEEYSEKVEEQQQQPTAQTAPTGVVGSEIEFNNNFNSYPERTAYNASHDATIHLGKDFSIPGEKLTFGQVISQDKQYIPINIGDVEQEVSHSKAGSLRIKPTKGLNVTPELVNEIVDKLNEVNAKTLNIAGNGIYDLTDYKQEDIDKFTYDLLEAVLTSPRLNNKIEKVVSGGQTGFDEAGVKASSKLGIKSEVNLPKEWTFRIAPGTKGDILGEAAFKARFKSQEGSGVVVEPQQNAPQGKVDIKRLPVRNKSEYVSPSNLNSSNIYSELDNEYLLSMLDDKGIVIGIRGKDVGNIPNTVYYAGESNSDTLQMLKKSGVTEPNDIKEKIMFFSDSELSNYNKDLKKIDSTDESIKKSEKLITDFIGSLKKNKKTYIPGASKIDIHKSKNKVFVTGFINTFNKLKNKKIIVDLFEGTDKIKRYYRILEDEVSKKEIGTFEASITERLDDKEKNINPVHGSFGTLFHYAMEYFMKEDVPGSLEAKKASIYDDKMFNKRVSEYNTDNSILKVKWEVSSRQVVDDAYKLAKTLKREFGNHYFLTEIPYAFNATNDPSKTTAGTIDLIAIDMNTGEGTIVDYKTSTKIAGEVDKYRKQLMVQALTLNLGNQSFKPINITGFTHVIVHKARDNNKSVFSISSSYNKSNLVKVENIKSNNSIYSIAGEVSEIYGVDLDLAMNAHEINNYINNIKPVDDIDNKLIEEYNEVDVFTNENIDIFVKKIDEHKNKNCK